MNKAALVSFATLCLFSTLLLTGCRISVKASPTTWTVDDDGPADFILIQEAINNATPGDTIFVRAGTYFENLVIDKSVSLFGEGRDSTIVDGNKTGSVVSITASNVSIEGFTIRRSGTRPLERGISMDRSTGTHIKNNAIINNNDGISLSSSINNVVSDNIVSSSNNDGISLYSSINNVVSGNTILNNDYGISLYSSINNVVSGNTISSNKNDGIILFDSSGNMIFHNNLVNNTEQTYSYSSTNIWEAGYEGNYWSNYDGIDFLSGPYQNETGSDGIGDTPYANGGVQDNYPLMGMYSEFKITTEGENYRVTTICNSTLTDFGFEIGKETGNRLVSFDVSGEEGTLGFCRILIPTELLIHPYILLVDGEETTPTLLDASNETHTYLYITYTHTNRKITIISSRTLHLYDELLDKHFSLQHELHNLNESYHDLLENYNILLGNHSWLQARYLELNNSYQEHLVDYSKRVHDLRNLMYIFAAATAIFLVSTVYLSKRAHETRQR